MSVLAKPDDFLHLKDQPVVYRCGGGPRGLLYIGSTTNLTGRLTTHQNMSFWWIWLLTVDYEIHGSKADTKKAERAAIPSERPRFNLQGRQPDRRLWSEEDYEDVIMALRHVAQPGHNIAQRIARLERELELRRIHGGIPINVSEVPA